MRVAITADLHIGITDDATVREMLATIVASGAQCLIAGGDLGEPPPNFEKCLRLLVGTGIPQVGVLAGNHDVWTSRNRDSADLFDNVLPGMCAEAGITWLENESMLLRGGVAICGTTAWYDYSDVPNPGRQTEIAKRKRDYNNDGCYIRWQYTDNEFSAMCRRGLLVRLKRLESNPSVSDVLLVTHVPIFAEQLVAHPGDNPISNHYFRNMVTGDAVVAATPTKLRWVVSGHTHRGVEPTEIEREGLRCRTAAVASDYWAPDFVIVEL